MKSTIEINGRAIGPEHSTYVIAEMSANHLQDLDRAHAIVDAAADAEADAVKLQTYTPDLLTIDSDKPSFQIEKTGLWDDRTLHDLYEGAYLPWEWHAELIDHAIEVGLACFSTPVDRTSLEFLEELDVPAHKISSFELVDTPLLKRVAGTGKPIILSTGMSTMTEIDEAVQTVREHGGPPLALLRCNSAYPAMPEEMDLRTIGHMAEAWNVPVGLSDHTLGAATAVAAVCLGACIVEKHLTLDRADGGPDSEFSMEPHEFERMVRDVRIAEEALGMVRYGPTRREQSSLVFRRSLFAVKDIEEGEALTEENVRSIRPSEGLPPKYLEELLGRHARTRIPRGTPIDWSMV